VLRKRKDKKESSQTPNETLKKRLSAVKINKLKIMESFYHETSFFVLFCLLPKLSVLIQIPQGEKKVLFFCSSVKFLQT
jgi:hypothetical protein